LGIVQQIAGTTKTSSGVAFAIPATIVQRTLRLSATNHDIPYAWTGISESRDLSPQLAKSQGIGTSSGALVQNASGPAQQAGISIGSPTLYMGEEVFVGDVVTSLAGQPIASSEDLRRVSGLLVAGETVSMTVMRGTASRTVQLTPTKAAFAVAG
ncbi:MAG: PDZ domain-containing protein, partial [Thermoleophilia bacterium]|nr:PDZ domain-containing protein [Thermoleophilia bacterium]